MAADARSIDAGVTVEDIVLGADTLIVHVQDLSSPAAGDINALSSPFKLVVQTFTAVGVHIPHLSTIALWEFSASKSIPPQGPRTVTGLAVGIPNFAVCAGDAAISIPVERRRAFTLVVHLVEELSLRAGKLALSTIPHPTFTTGHADIVRGLVVVDWAEVDTLPITDQLVARAVLAL